MRVLRACRIGAAACFVLVVVGCRGGSTAVDISLAKFGGALKVQMDLNRGDKFVYETTNDVHAKSPFADIDAKQSETSELEVIDRTDGDTRFVMTVTKVDVQSSSDEVEAKMKKSVERIKGLRVEGFYTKYGSTKSVQAVSTDPLVTDLVAEEYDADPGLFGIVLPPAAAHIGDHWTAVHALRYRQSVLDKLFQTSESVPQVTVDYKLVGAQEDDGRTLAVIEWGYSFNPSNTQASGLSADAANLLNAPSLKITAKARVDVRTGMVFDEKSEVKQGNGFIEVTEKIDIKMKSGR